ncbi:hypothetical protein [Hymenobacter negativus]|uniref:REase AHJR-like domain-containing protein n=1 Tax=Hymenobacter negativus TaxID=2795026 RepID=A0ABS3QEZ3_9BACT|nr:hypothetical protein [Hymenobacter negativus]MBO2009742.1 hypothetical protein [Hymenobacter negativus]
MNTDPKTKETTKVLELARSYEAQGFVVKTAPAAEDIPFDLGPYRPDLLAEKEGQHFIIEVKKAGVPLSVDRLQALAETIRQHAGWRLLLVPTDEEGPVLPTGNTNELVSWQAVAERAKRADHLLQLGESDAAFLMLWSAFEAMLRRHAEQVGLPIERLSTAALLDYLYSQGELAYEQFEQARAALQVRNRLVHGFEAAEATQEARPLHTLVEHLLQEWTYTQNAA